MGLSSSPEELRADAIKVVVSLCLTYSLCLILAGLWIRIRSRTYAWDDVVGLIATVGHFTEHFAKRPSY